ncbi:penicillin-binding protein activator LpoB [Pantoea sp. Aalb]|uniref:penicillin-binding protein activator LpoB n=1 Tax=Pantoea sp. Aalb TaxID=2576762 RepID=UPI00135A25EA|nr:penicillin-binding protein activator LpoB [Pantoea sp. Aalb]
MFKIQQFIIVLFIIILNSCAIEPKKIKNSVKSQVVTPSYSTESTTILKDLKYNLLPSQIGVEKVPYPPNLKNIDWKASMIPLFMSMKKSTENISTGRTLVVDCMENYTNGSLQIDQAINVIRTALNSEAKFTLISISQLNKAKQEFGLLPDDRINSHSKGIWLSRLINAEYLLCSTMHGNVKSPTIKMQLMLVKTGEIIWSSDSIAHF